MTKANQIYTDEFKKEAVALVEEMGYSCRQAGEAVGTSPKNISRWVRCARQRQDGIVLISGERAENKRLRMEHEILKKASDFFAKQML